MSARVITGVEVAEDTEACPVENVGVGKPDSMKEEKRAWQQFTRNLQRRVLEDLVNKIMGFKYLNEFFIVSIA